MDRGILSVFAASLLCGALSGCGSGMPDDAILGQLADAQQQLAQMQETMDELKEKAPTPKSGGSCNRKSKQQQQQQSALTTQLAALQKTIEDQKKKIKELEDKLDEESEGTPQEPEGPAVPEEPTEGV